MIIHKCDGKGCNSQFIQKRGTIAITPKDWIEMTLLYRSVKYEICPACIQRLGIPEDKCKQREDIADRLMDILEEMATEALANIS